MLVEQQVAKARSHWLRSGREDNLLGQGFALLTDQHQSVRICADQLRRLHALPIGKPNTQLRQLLPAMNIVVFF
jgi:hypothetical protein